MFIYTYFCKQEALERLEDEEGASGKLEDEKRSLETLRDELQDKIEDNTQTIAKVSKAKWDFSNNQYWSPIVSQLSLDLLWQTIQNRSIQFHGAVLNQY